MSGNPRLARQAGRRQRDANETGFTILRSAGPSRSMALSVHEIDAPSSSPLAGLASPSLARVLARQFRPFNGHSRRTAPGRAEPTRPSVWSPQTCRSQVHRGRSFERVATGGLWPGRVKERFRLVAGNLPFADMPTEDFRARREGRLMAGTASTTGSPSAAVGAQGSQHAMPFPVPASRSRSRPQGSLSVAYPATDS